MKRFVKRIILLLVSLLPFTSQAEPTSIRIAVLAYGTANWELNVIEQQGLAKKQGLILDISPVASPQAGKIALQGDSTDLIVSDWIWVSRQRSKNIDLTFAPYSNTHGALMVPADSPIDSIEKLRDIKLGIAGGGLDKNWLLLRALAGQKHGLDLTQSLTPQFGAPPLLNRQLEQGNLDALMNYWHYAARLEAKGYRRLLDSHTIVTALGIEGAVPALGYVFRESWAEKNRSALLKFLQITREAKERLCQSDDTWQSISHLVKAEHENTNAILRKRYCEGRVTQWGESGVEVAARTHSILRQVGGDKLTGRSKQLSPGTFWTGAFIQ